MHVTLCLCQMSAQDTIQERACIVPIVVFDLIRCSMINR